MTKKIFSTLIIAGIFTLSAVNVFSADAPAVQAPATAPTSTTSAPTEAASSMIPESLAKPSLMASSQNDVPMQGMISSVFSKIGMPPNDKSGSSLTEIQTQIEAERAKMMMQSQDVEMLKEQLAKAASDLAKKSEELEKLAVAKQAEDPDMRLIVTLYESVDPKKAAEMLKRLDSEMVLAVMRMMSPRKASRVLAEMEDRLAARVSMMLVERPKLAENTKEKEL